MNRRLSILFLTLFVSSLSNYSVNAQNRVDSLQNIKELIRKDNTVSSEGVGLFFTPSKYWYAFVYILYLATNEELEQMTSDKSQALRIYAYTGLLYNKYSDLKSIKKRLSKDRETVETFFGCISGLEMDVANCIKKLVKDHFRKESIDYLLSSLNNNEKYRNQLFDDLLNDRKITRPINE